MKYNNSHLNADQIQQLSYRVADTLRIGRNTREEAYIYDAICNGDIDARLPVEKLGEEYKAFFLDMCAMYGDMPNEPDPDPFCVPPLSAGNYDTTAYEGQWA